MFKIVHAVDVVSRGLLRRVAGTWGRWSALGAGATFGKACRLKGAPIITLAPDSAVRIGDRVVITSSSSGTDLGVRGPCVIRTLAAGASINIGADCGLSGAVICAHRSVEIGNGVLIGADVMIFDTNFHPVAHRERRYASVDPQLDVSPVKIGSNVFIGAGSIVCKGVSIGDNSVIGAGSIVTSNIPSNSIAAGVPARVLKAISFG